MNKQAKTAFISAIVLMMVLGFVFVIAKSSGKGAKQCNDGIDNDGDGFKDMRDAGCVNPSDNDETNCGDGVCEGGETSGNCPQDCGVPNSCNDTDGGNFPFLFGTTSGYLNNIWYSHDDYCVDSSTIKEYYCSGNYEQSSQQSCGTDAYGANYCINSSVYRDYTDYYCANGKCDSGVTRELVEQCGYGCTNGTCNPIPNSCSDSDGGIVFTVNGTVSGYKSEQGYNYADYCRDSSTVMEYYCVSNLAYNFTSSCVGNTTSSCVGGKCV